MTTSKFMLFSLLSGVALAACGFEEDGSDRDAELRAKPVDSSDPEAARNLHLAPRIRFIPMPEGANVDEGRKLFGVAENLVDEDKTDALFEGFSASANADIVSNERTCFTCHRGIEERFGIDLPKGTKLSDNVDLSDALFTGIEADAQGDPDAFDILDNHALFKYTFNRFDRRPAKDGFADVFAWRKSPQLLNVGLTHGLLNDGRVPSATAADRGAVNSHTQDGNLAIDDLLSPEQGNDMLAFQLTLFTDERLAGLRDPTDPLYDELVSDPYYTVDITDEKQELGRDVFDEYCFACHNTPNVFSALENVEPQANGERPPDRVSWSASVGKTYNVGVAELNKHDLRFTKHLGDGKFEPIVLPLAKEDGTLVEHEVSFDVGLAATTGRHADVGRFKVPQLRNLRNNAPYFHDNSADTIEEVVDYFESEHYNQSADGQFFPIYLTDEEREALIEFLYIL